MASLGHLCCWGYRSETVGSDRPERHFHVLGQESAELLRSSETQIDEMEKPIRTFSTRNFDREWRQGKKNRARHWVTNGAVSQDAALCKCD